MFQYINNNKWQIQKIPKISFLKLTKNKNIEKWSEEEVDYLNKYV